MTTEAPHRRRRAGGGDNWPPRSSWSCLLAIYPVRRLAHLSADPAEPKDCPPIEPGRDARDAPRAGIQSAPPAALGAARRDDQRRQLPQSHAGPRRRRREDGGRRPRRAGVRAKPWPESLDRRRPAQHGRAGIRRRSAGARHAGFQPDRARRRGAHRHGAERRDVARHPEGPPPAFRREGDAVHRHLHGRRIDLGERARHGSSRRFRRPHRPGDAGDAPRRLDPRRQPRPRIRNSSGWSSADTVSSASFSMPISRSPTTSSTDRSGACSTTGSSPTCSRGSLARTARYGLMYGAPVHLAGTAAGGDAALHLSRGEADGAAIPPLGEVSQVKLRRRSSTSSKRGPLWMRLKWFAEKHVEPRLESCAVSRTEAMGQAEGCFVSRNDPMHDSVAVPAEQPARRDRYPARILRARQDVRRSSSTGCATSSARSAPT